GEDVHLIARVAAVLHLRGEHDRGALKILPAPAAAGTGAGHPEPAAAASADAPASAAWRRRGEAMREPSVDRVSARLHWRYFMKIARRAGKVRGRQERQQRERRRA